MSTLAWLATAIVSELKRRGRAVVEQEILDKCGAPDYSPERVEWENGLIRLIQSQISKQLHTSYCMKGITFET